MSTLKLARRLEKLERSEVFAGPQVLWNQFEAALNAHSLRTTGKLYRAVPRDDGSRDRIFNEVSTRFLQDRTDAELDFLEADLRRRGPGQCTGFLGDANTGSLTNPAGAFGNVESEAQAEW